MPVNLNDEKCKISSILHQIDSVFPSLTIIGLFGRPGGIQLEVLHLS